MNKEYGLVSENNGSTVVAEYSGLKRKDTIPFIPFIFISYVGVMICG